MRHNLKDVTFLIPIRIDSMHRLENLMMTTDFLHKHFSCNIHVLEAGKYNNSLIQRMIKSINYTFIEDYDPVFYRTKYLNKMALNSKTPYLGIWDTDIVIPTPQLLEAIDVLRKKRAEIAYPYDGTFLDTSFILREYYFSNKMDLSFLVRNKNKMKSVYGKDCKGGAIFVNKDAYIKSGMENENFYGWGPEDSERYMRWMNLDYRIFRSEGCLFHLSHGRGDNSSFRNEEKKEILLSEYLKTANSSKNEIMTRLTKQK